MGLTVDHQLKIISCLTWFANILSNLIILNRITHSNEPLTIHSVPDSIDVGSNNSEGYQTKILHQLINPLTVELKPVDWYKQHDQGPYDNSSL